MSSSQAEIVDFTSHFLAGVLRRNERYDCTQPEVYNQFLHDVASAMAQTPTTRASVTDIDRAIRATPTLRTHPMLTREHYFSDEHALLSDTVAPQQSLLSAVGTSLRAFFAPADEAALVAETERIARVEATRVRALVRERLAAEIANGNYRTTSSTTNNEFYVCVPAEYLTSTAAIVERELQLEYPQAHSGPYLFRYTRFNLTRALRHETKTMLLTMFFFRLSAEPRRI